MSEVTAAIPPHNSANTSVADHESRRRIRDSHDETLFVVAAAGTGKTSSLVARIVALVATGRTDLGDLAAITFTEAAAAELRDRIRTALTRAAQGNDPLVGDAESRDRCARARQRVDEAALCTLHAFAQRIIASAPMRVGVPPRFAVVDEIDAAMSFATRWSQLLDTLLDDPSLTEAFERALTFGITLTNWRDIAQALHSQWDRVPGNAHSTLPEPQLSPTALPPLRCDALIAAFAALLEMRAECTDLEDKLLGKINDCVLLHDELMRAQDLEIIDVVCGREYPKPGNLGKKDAWSIDKSEVKACFEAITEARSAFITAQGAAIYDIITPYLCEWCIDGAAQRARDGLIEFHDLLVLARNLLRDNPDIGQQMSRRYRYLLMDEFQDTDPLQIELALRIAAAATPALAPADADISQSWESLAVEPGRLFFVGDPKQSIYRFRRADLELYHRIQAMFPGGGVALSHNFRSVPGIIEWMNATFEGVLNATGDPALQASPMPLTAHRVALDGPGPVVATFGAPTSERAADQRLAEASDIAAIVTEAVNHWMVLDPNTETPRPARLNDIALLLPTRAALDAIDHAFDIADITARVESRSLVFATSEVRELLSILQSIDDPTATIATVAALRTPGFGCSDRELAQWSLASGSWDYRVAPPASIDPTNRVGLAMQTLAEFHAQRWWRTVSDTVLAVIQGLQLEAFATFHRRPRDRWRRVQFLLHHATSWDERTQSLGLGAFVTWAQSQADEGASAIEVPVAEPDDDAVRILTIHGSKGLEFPIVILGGVGASPATRVPAVIFTGDGPQYTGGRGTFRVNAPGYSEARAREHDHETAERARLLYVAATRARDHLVVSRHHNATRATKSPAAVLEPHFPINGAQHLDPQSFTPRPRSVQMIDPSNDRDTRETIIAEFDQRALFLGRAARPAVVSATAVARHAASSNTRLRSTPRDTPRDTPRGNSGALIGRAVHAVLQDCDLGSGADIGDLALAHSQTDGLNDYTTLIAELARSIQACDLVHELIDGQHWREVHVAASIDGVGVEGYIDLLAMHNETFVIVDYKTDLLLTDEEIDAAVERYTPQAVTYALAVEETTSETVSKVAFIFARADGATVRSIDELTSAKTSTRQLITSL